MAMCKLEYKMFCRFLRHVGWENLGWNLKYLQMQLFQFIMFLKDAEASIYKINRKCFGI